MLISPEMHLEEGPPGLWRFADCEFDESRYELRVSGQVADLERKPLDLLRCLLLKSGDVVRKEDLLRAVWPEVLVVDASLATAMSKLRKALQGRDVIQTVPRVGYRIAVPVTRHFREQAAPPPVEPELPAIAGAGDPAPASYPWLRTTIGTRAVWTGLGVVLTIGASVGILSTLGTTRAAPERLTIAVLPFQNDAPSANLDFLRSALPDEISNELAAAHSVTLRPAAATARYAGAGIDFRKAGRDLDVNRIVTGHFTEVNDQVQITIEAVNPAENQVLWNTRFDVPKGNMLAMQSQIAAATRGSMARALGVKGFAGDEAPRATSEQAYELYLKSVGLDWDPEPNKIAIDLLRKVVLLDPNYAPAWGMLSLRYYSYGRFGGGGPAMLAFSDAAAEKQLALNPDSVDPLAELTLHRAERGELVKAHQVALELLKRKPDDPNLHHVLSYVLRYGGSLDEAGRECDLVVLLASKVIWGSCSTTFMELGNYPRAREFLRKDLSSEWSKAHAIEVLLREGKTEEALRIPAPQIPHWDSYKMLLACARGAPRSEISSLASRVETDDDPEVDYFFAGHLAFCGQTSSALQMLKTAVDHKYCSYPALDQDPFFSSLRGDPQFEKLRRAAMRCHDDFANNRDTGRPPDNETSMK